jgi:NTP pyrophosphatase (non-canonical NTP hydrolase)
MLMITEVAEAMEAVQKADIANLGEELADVVIRVMDFAFGWTLAHPDKPIDLQAEVMAKLERNRQRGYRHGGKRA